MKATKFFSILMGNLYKVVHKKLTKCKTITTMEEMIENNESVPTIDTIESEKSIVNSIYFMGEKMPNHGEDSEPICITHEKTSFVAVFDGMGGAGATKCKSDYGDDKTKAYIASRIIRELVKNLILEGIDLNEQLLHDKIDERLKLEIEKYPMAKSTLRSSLVRDYPTTMALLVAHREGETTKIDSYWAGDSRNYLWTKDGLFQLSIDDIQSSGDAMENLHNDSPMSNCICADRPFTINHKHIEIAEPCLLLSSTDGCFGYYPSPMHFEAVLKDTLQQSNSYVEWKEMLQQRIIEVTGDDISLSAVVIPQLDFKQVQECMTKDVVRFHEIKALETKIQEVKTNLKNLQEKYPSLLQEIWEEGKAEYSKYLNLENYGNA